MVKLRIVRISVISMISGMAVMITSSLFLDDFRQFFETHIQWPYLCTLSQTEADRCNEVFWWIGIGFAGVLLSTVQVISQIVFGLGYFLHWRLWLWLQIMIAILESLLTCLGFMYGVHQFGGQDGRAYMAFLFLNVLFSLVSPFIISKEDDQEEDMMPDIESIGGSESTYSSSSSYSDNNDNDYQRTNSLSNSSNDSLQFRNKRKANSFSKFGNRKRTKRAKVFNEPTQTIQRAATFSKLPGMNWKPRGEKFKTRKNITS